MKRRGLITALTLILLAFWLSQPSNLEGRQDLPCLNTISPTDSLLFADPEGTLIYKKNEGRKTTPASTLKLLTALTALHYLRNSYRFQTEFYVDSDQNLKIKGYGDPLLISEVWQEIADDLSRKIRKFKDLVLDDAYFSPNIVIPGVGKSANPYDAPVGALCANFNTIFFDRDDRGQIISAEPQTPIIPFSRGKIGSLRIRKGRYTFTHNGREATLYAGALLLHFLRERGMESQGKIRLGAIVPEDRLVYTYRSRFTLEQALRKMMEFSNNFIANQIFIGLGAFVLGPPGTLAKGARVISDFAKKELGLKGIEIVEGSGISPRNRLSALHMLVILRHFENYRHLLNRKGNILYKTGSLRGVRTRAGYMEGDVRGPYYFVIFINQDESNIDSLMECLSRTITKK